jgi:hypothetical protein
MRAARTHFAVEQRVLRGRDLLLRDELAIAVSVFSRLAELQPPAACLAAWAGVTANATAAIAITPSNFVMTLPSFSCSWARASDIAGICDITFLRARQLDAMNSPRELRDVARRAELHAKFLIFITRL